MPLTMEISIPDISMKFLNPCQFNNYNGMHTPGKKGNVSNKSNCSMYVFLKFSKGSEKHATSCNKLPQSRITLPSLRRCHAVLVHIILSNCCVNWATQNPTKYPIRLHYQNLHSTKPSATWHSHFQVHHHPKTIFIMDKRASSTKVLCV